MSERANTIVTRFWLKVRFLMIFLKAADWIANVSEQCCFDLQPESKGARAGAAARGPATQKYCRIA